VLEESLSLPLVLGEDGEGLDPPPGVLEESLSLPLFR
jgi:hypothetical protein